MLKNTPLISVVMSIYNNQSTLEKSVHSILNQNYKNFEFLIVDDNSTDNSFMMLRNLAKNDKRIKVFKNDKNIGLTKSLNILLSKANGNYIARQDGDDFSERERFSKQVKFLEESKTYDACSTRTTIIHSNKIIPGLSRFIPIKYLIKFKNPIIHGSLMIRSETMKKLGFYNEIFYYAQDYKLIYDFIKRNHKIKILDSSLYNSNMSNNISTIYLNEQKYFASCVKKNIIP